jgi:hypothetical protein
MRIIPLPSCHLQSDKTLSRQTVANNSLTCGNATTKVTGRRPETSNSKEASPAAPVDRLVRHRRTLAPNHAPPPGSQASPSQAILHPAQAPTKLPEHASIRVFPCPSVVPLAIAVPTAATQRNSTTHKNSRCRLLTHRDERSLGRRTTLCPVLLRTEPFDLRAYYQRANGRVESKPAK